MPNRALVFGFAALLPALSGCGFGLGDVLADSNRFTEEFSYSLPLTSGGRVDVENFNGPIDISAWDRESVEITGQKHASAETLLRDTKIDIVRAPDGLSIRIRTIRPTERGGNVGARYSLRVPRRVTLERIVTSNGAITVNDVAGGVFLRTSNGGIRANDVHGPLDAQTSNGGIEARLRNMDPNAPIRVQTSNGSVTLDLAAMQGHRVQASTSNGSITVRLPADTSADIRASTSNSSIATDFNVQTEGPGQSKTSLRGKIGGGGGSLDLDTSNGAIRLVKQS